MTIAYFQLHTKREVLEGFQARPGGGGGAAQGRFFAWAAIARCGEGGGGGGLGPCSGGKHFFRSLVLRVWVTGPSWPSCGRRANELGRLVPSTSRGLGAAPPL